MHHSTTALLTAAVLGLGLAACAGDDATDVAGDTVSTSPAATASPDVSPDTDDSSPAEASEATVAIDDFAYDPPTITVPVGSTVTWTNEDATRHTVTAGSEDAPAPDRFDEEVTEQGQTVQVTFDEPGTHAYYCVLHPFMEGTIEVTG